MCPTQGVSPASLGDDHGRRPTLLRVGPTWLSVEEARPCERGPRQCAVFGPSCVDGRQESAPFLAAMRPADVLLAWTAWPGPRRTMLLARMSMVLRSMAIALRAMVARLASRMPLERPSLRSHGRFRVEIRRMVGGYRRTGILHDRILLALRVNLRGFVEIVPALAAIPLGTRAKGTSSQRSRQLPRRRRGLSTCYG